MTILLGMSHHTGTRLGEVGFLLIGLAGVWLAAAQMPRLGFTGGRTTVAGLGLAVGAVLLIIAIHWAHFG